jgi:predicted component of type VI protein secretion system
LFRNGTFYLRDEMASNSSYVNDIEVLPNSTVALKDGDRLRLGAHTFLLRTAAQ